MKFQLVKKTLPGGEVRFYTEADDGAGVWEYVSGSVSHNPDQARAFFAACTNAEKPSTEILAEVEV